MKRVLFCSIFILSATLAVSAQKTTKTAAKPAAKATAKTPVKASVPPFKNLIDSFSYAAGFNVATNMQAQGITKLNTVLMQKGIEDVFKKNDAKLSPEVINACMQKQLDIFAAEKGSEERNKGIAFLEANKKRREVIVLPDGLQYEVIKNGDAGSPTAKAVDTVEVNYKVALIDGKDIQNTFKSGQPAVFPVMGVIKGWIEILQLMRKGDHWKVYVPTELAYGAAGNGSAIPPNAALVFEMSLENIRPAVTK